jgi:hypothetical protein
MLAAFLLQKSIHLPYFLSLYTVGAALLILLVLWLVNRYTIHRYIARAR